VAIRVGIDTGGTFTDLVAVDERRGTWYLAKVPSSREHPVETLTSALRQAGFDPAEVSFIVVGTTIGINAVLTRTGARVLYLTTRGFEDIPHIQRINRKNHYDFVWRKPTPLVKRRDCVGISERTNSEGAVIEPLHPDDVRRAVAEHRDTGEDVAVAICFLFSYLNPSAELAAREEIETLAPELPVSLSHEVAPIWREYERGTAAILDAYLKPDFARYVSGVGEAFGEEGVRASWSLLKSNGGHALSSEARALPSHILLSGIAGGAIGGAYVARQRDADKAVVLDMGGTSCDVCLTAGGEPTFSSEFEIEFGLPVVVPTVSTKTIGAGGGSIGWIDPGGFLQVGPQSAGADPGPACYGQGGSDATLTDANLVLGRLNPEFFLGGAIKLDPELSRAALTRLSERLGADPVHAASSMVQIANENMANAIRIVTVEQGIDPREYALIAMGGAGPTHAAEIAASVGMNRVIVPQHPGLASAFGALAARVRVDEVRSVNLKSTTISAGTLNEMFAALEASALTNFELQGGSVQPPTVQRSIAMRYEGQNYEQEIPIDEGEFSDSLLEGTFERYHALHQEFYGYRFEGVPIEMVRLLVTVLGDEPVLPPLGQQALGGAEAEETRERVSEVHFPGIGFVSTPVVGRGELAPRESRAGPLVVESMDTTVVVPPGWSLLSDAAGILELQHPHPDDGRSPAQAGAAAAARAHTGVTT
jgi:N-methylhydantoinase A